MSEKLILSDKTFKIIGAAMEVHNTIGCGFTEPLYQEAFEEELRLRGIPYQRERKIDVYYKNYKLPHQYYADFLCYDSIIVELKATDGIASEHRAQVLNYMNATHYSKALLINLGEPRLRYERFIM